MLSKNTISWMLPLAAMCCILGSVASLEAVCRAKKDNVAVNVQLSQDIGEETKLVGNVTGLTAGKHGFHIHESGSISKGCADAKGHYNPFDKVHGGPEAAERHVGDLGNVNADAQGNVAVQMSDNQVNLSGKQSVMGRAIVVHAGEDDLGQGGHKDSNTTGNAGGRLVCCKITPVTSGTGTPLLNIQLSIAALLLAKLSLG